MYSSIADEFVTSSVFVEIGQGTHGPLKSTLRRFHRPCVGGVTIEWLQNRYFDSSQRDLGYDTSLLREVLLADLALVGRIVGWKTLQSEFTRVIGLGEVVDVL